MSAIPVIEAPRRSTGVGIVDDHGVVRGGLRLLLQGQEGISVVGEACDVPGALRLVAEQRPDVLVLDLLMPGPSSIAAIPEIRRISPRTHVVILTVQGDVAYARAALRAGADGYVLKEAADEELVRAVRAAAVGETFLDPHLGAELARSAAGAESSQPLSPRELEVLRLIGLGHTNAEIGARLALGVRTIETHRSHIQRKLGLTTRAELVAYALSHGLLDASSGRR
jgi:two-component system response regulator NreC